MATYALDQFSPAEVKAAMDAHAKGMTYSQLIMYHDFSGYTQIQNYFDAYKSGKKYRFHLRFYIHEVEDTIRTMSLEEAYHWLTEQEYIKMSFRRWIDIARSLDLTMQRRYKRKFTFRGREQTASQIYQQVRHAFSRRSVYNYCREHGEFDPYNAPERRRRPTGYRSIVDLAIKYGFPYHRLYLMHVKHNYSLNQLEDYLKESA